MVHSPIVVNGDAMKPSTVSKTTSLFLANPVEKMLLSGYSKDPKTNKNTYFYMEHKSNQTRTLQQKRKVIQELKSYDQAELPPHATVSARTPAVPPAQIRRASFSQVPSHIPIRRTKSEGHARGDVTSARLAQQYQRSVQMLPWMIVFGGNWRQATTTAAYHPPLVSVQVTLPLKSLQPGQKESQQSIYSQQYMWRFLGQLLSPSVCLRRCKSNLNL